MTADPQKITLKTQDGFEIVGDFYEISDKNAPTVVLSHMMPATKESWKDFAGKLNQAGLNCFAVDLRGHGESQDGPVGFKNYTDSQHQLSIKDLESAFDFLIKSGIYPDSISFVGASIGANLSLWFQSEHPETRTSVLLSPGLDYKGIETEKLVKKIHEGQKVFLVAGGENDEYSTETVIKLNNLINNENKTVKILNKAGHGTDIFKEEPILMDEIVSWLKKIYLDA